MLKILSEKLPFYEEELVRDKLVKSDEQYSGADLRSSICLNVLYLIFNISYGTSNPNPP